ncbi:MAG: DUF58 domain-containing protein [Micrococcales bacterium]|nr:DUF58 domain-containing protein [Micrococcales bacterium]
MRRARSGRRVAVRERRRALGRRLRPVGVLARVLALGVRRLGALARPVVGVISPMGGLVVLIAVGAATLGFALGWQEFVYLAVTLGGALVVAAAFLFGRGAFRAVVELTPRRVTAGQRALGRLEVENAGQRPSTPTRMELPVGAGVAEFLIPALEPGRRHEELFAVPTQRRAVITAGPAVSVRGDQLGLLRRALRWTDPIELFVHPLTVRLQTSTAGLIRDLEGEVTKTVTSNDISFHALRPYEPGDDRRYVHWRTSARTGQLMVRQFEETRRSQVVVLFVTRRDHYASDDEFELAVSTTASLAAQILRDDTHADVVAEDRVLRTTTITSMLDDSCRLAPTPARHASPRDFARTATLRLPAPSVAMVICGSRMPDADLRAIERLFGFDCQTVAFRADLDAEPSLAILGGLRLATVGALADLQRLVRRMA